MSSNPITVMPGMSGKFCSLTAETLSRFVITYDFRPVFRQQMDDHQVFSHYCCKKDFMSIDLFTGYDNGFYAQIFIKGDNPATKTLSFLFGGISRPLQMITGRLKIYALRKQNSNPTILNNPYMTKKKTGKSEPGIFEKIIASAANAKESIGAAAIAVAETVGEKYESVKEAAKSYITDKVKPARKVVKSTKKPAKTPAKKFVKKAAKKSTASPAIKKAAKKTAQKRSKKSVTKTPAKKKAAPKKKAATR